MASWPSSICPSLPGYGRINHNQKKSADDRFRIRLSDFDMPSSRWGGHSCPPFLIPAFSLDNLPKARQFFSHPAQETFGGPMRFALFAAIILFHLNPILLASVQ